MERSNFPRGIERAGSQIGWGPGGGIEALQPTDGGIAGYHLGARLDDFGDIYEGLHPRLPGPFVIKLFEGLAGSSPTAVAAFSLEVGRISILHHPHIAQVFDSGVLGERTPFVAMERLHGRTLEEHLTLGGPLPLTHLLAVLRGVVSALSAAHAAGIAHRELRPSNVFLVDVADQDPGLVKLLDFGVSRLTWAAEGSARRGISVDDSRYLAPELARGDLREVDPRADQYAVAALVCRVLHGAAALPRDPIVAQANRSADTRARPVRPVAGRGSAVKSVLIKGLSENPDDRYPSVAAFLQSLERALAPESTPSRTADDSAGDPLHPDSPYRQDPANRDGTLTKRFFQEGDLQQRNNWKDSPLATEPVAADPDIEFTSFNRIPKKRKPLIAVAMISVLGLGVLAAWSVGWRSPRTVWAESRLGRAIYLLNAGSPGNQASTATASIDRAHGSPAAPAARAAPISPPRATVLAAGGTIPIAPVPLPLLPAATVPAASVLAAAPALLVVSSPRSTAARGDAARGETVPAIEDAAPVVAVARPTPAPASASATHPKRTAALRGYVWSPTERRLVPSRSRSIAAEPSSSSIDSTPLLN